LENALQARGQQAVQKDRELEELKANNKRLVEARAIDLGQHQLLERKILKLQSQQRGAVGMQGTALQQTQLALAARGAAVGEREATIRMQLAEIRQLKSRVHQLEQGSRCPSRKGHPRPGEY
jgi:hypothetical protein